jgi:hypothetical protein
MRRSRTRSSKRAAIDATAAGVVGPAPYRRRGTSNCEGTAERGARAGYSQIQLSNSPRSRAKVSDHKPLGRKQACAIVPFRRAARGCAFSFLVPHMREGSGAPKGATVFIGHLFGGAARRVTGTRASRRSTCGVSRLRDRASWPGPVGTTASVIQAAFAPPFIQTRPAIEGGPPSGRTVPRRPGSLLASAGIRAPHPAPPNKRL